MIPILNPEVLEIWKHWIIERNRIYIRREIEHRPHPWTEDEIMKTFRFTNVKRWQDRESRWLIDNICANDCLSMEDKVYNCILFRLWNKGSSFEIICGKGITTEDLRKTPIEEFESRVTDYSSSHPEYIWFTSAFNTGGLKQAWKYPGKSYRNTHTKGKREEFDNPVLCIPVRMIYIVKDCIEKDLYRRIIQSPTAEAVFQCLMGVKGLAEFLAYQVYVDLTYIPGFPFTEEDFVKAGPGCKAGEDYLFKSRSGLSYDEALYWLRDHQDEFFGDSLRREFSYLPEERQRLTVMDIENSMCELGKYCKVYFNKGRPKNKYHYK